MTFEPHEIKKIRCEQWHDYYYEYLRKYATIDQLSVNEVKSYDQRKNYLCDK